MPYLPSTDAIVIGDGSVFVDIFLDAGDDLKTKTPSICLIRNGEIRADFTWDSAREVGQALIDIANLGENG